MMNQMNSATKAHPPSESPVATRSASRPSRQFFRDFVLRRLKKLQHGQLFVTDPFGTFQAGEPTDSARDSLAVSMTVHDPSVYKEVLLGGSLGVADAYLEGKWTCDDLTNLIRIFCRNFDHTSDLDRGFSKWAHMLAKAAHRLARNTLSGSRKNISAHYDLSNEFFQLFLDPTMLYSSAYYSHPEMSLEQASLEKLNSICRRLDLKPTDRVLEIGTGWGGFAIHAATQFGCQITTTTISQQQYILARDRVQTRGLEDQITLLTEDYRKLTGQYDKIVSIEMIEAVGHEYLTPYFQKCHDLLVPGGQFFIQAITIPDQRYENYRRSVDFIQKYIFPGGHLPSLGAMQAAASSATDFRLLRQEDFGKSYALTLREWRKRFFERIAEVRALGFDERFIRMWDYYLCYCEGAFLEQSVGVSHLLWQKPRY